MYVLANSDTVLKHPYSVAELRADNPQVSFPAEPPDALLAEFGVFPCVEIGKPTISYTQNVAKIFNQVNGVWTQDWGTTDASPEEIAERTRQQSADIREQRNQMLTNCDWTQLPDAPVDQAAWASYRQDLRDITNQVEFPWNIVWPIEP